MKFPSQVSLYAAPTPKVEEIPEGIKDGINYPDDSTKVILSLLAPGKKFVYVIGDFNDWQPQGEYLMKQSPDKERFWLEIENLEPGKEYIFQYLIDGILPIADPYTEKVSNPIGDKFIYEDTYPNLIAYPEGKTQYSASVFQTNQKPFQWKIRNFAAPQPKDLIIYELLIRDFTAQHAYKAVRDSLDYLVELGINAIELMPVNEFEGNLSWGYNPVFYFAPDKYYGPKEELKKLIDAAHEKGIAVLIDLVLNHSFNSAPMVRMYWDEEKNKPTKENPWYNISHNFDNTDAHWGTDFNHESTYTQHFIDNINRFWIEEYQIDGFRFDFTKGFSNERKPLSDLWGSEYDSKRVAILKQMVDKIREVDKDNIIIFEHLAENEEEKELADYGILLWGNMNHHYRNLIKGENDDLSHQDYQRRNWKQPNLIAYMESHDEERLMYEAMENGKKSGTYNLKDETTALNRLKMGAAFYFTFPGPKMIWQFGELGYDIPIDFNGRTGEKPIKWEYLNHPERHKLFKVYQALIKFKKENAIFNTTSYRYSLDQHTKWLKLEGNDFNVMVVGNFGLETKDEVLEFPQTGKWFDFFTGEKIEVKEKIFVFRLAPGQFHILTDKAIDFPERDLVPYSPNQVTGLTDIIEEINTLKIYPNPVKESFYIYLNGKPESKGQIKLFDLTGKEVWKSGITRLNKKRPKKIYLPQLDSGMYFSIFNSDQGDYLKSKIVIE
ncbi:alpha-amylase family glycosyl hydrolase [Flexithrix dorotheae]|uniref:alpha-amylase family glycosyl hydrolase n=1 Tax=Flexithrix dorotheae TaxID=70993 RepID=UPI000361336D|nr:alpha-amylase family glycosyl hydrolase [Flexithrix dorotheae]